MVADCARIIAQVGSGRTNAGPVRDRRSNAFLAAHPRGGVRL